MNGSFNQGNHTMAKAKTTKITPLDDRVLVQPQEAEEKTASGLYLPEGAKEKPQTGTIVAAGPGKLTDEGERTPLTVKKGDTVIYGKYGGTEIDVDGSTLMIMRESELLGVMQ